MKKNKSLNKEVSSLDTKIDVITSVCIGAIYLFFTMTTSALGFLFCSLFMIHAIVLYFLFKVKGKIKFLMLSCLLVTGATCYYSLVYSHFNGDLNYLMRIYGFTTWGFLGISPFFIKSFVMLAFDKRDNQEKDKEQL